MVGFIEGFRKLIKWERKRKDEILLRGLAVGITSTVDYAEDKHIILLDYDVRDFQRVKRSVEECQKFWGLSDFFIFKTMNGYHAIAFYDIVPYGRLKLIIDYARDVDHMFKMITRFYSHKTLRAVGKYKTRDIEFYTLLQGVRDPTEEEFEIGELKRAEHMSLIGAEY
jgi:hypothetical protein